MNIIGAALAFIVGAAVAVLNYSLSRFMLKKHPQQYAAMQVVRQLLQVGYLLAIFFLAGYTPWDRMWLLVGGCLGVTLPMIWFTMQLLKLNQSLQGKEESSDG
ncbi:MAG: hypothetical protein IJP27_08465 [Clostridia bacterium]|nr:hypothetical protein [Clostridia bacterium]